MNQHAEIKHVSDTALWVAHYRAQESKRADALFHDDLAELLVGDAGEKIANTMKHTAKFTQWSVVIRTLIIDRYIQKLAKEGVDTVINLGAGMDTRPYRLNLPGSLRWIEVDYPHVIAHKEKILKEKQPAVKLERMALDLADATERKNLFAGLNAGTRKAVILTEGVIPYLSEAHVAELARDLHAQPNFKYWIAEYMAAIMYRHLQTKKRKAMMKNAPFQFFPPDWLAFFKKNGWQARETQYFMEESEKAGRRIPLPWFAYVIFPFISRETIEKNRRGTGYVIFEKAEI